MVISGTQSRSCPVIANDWKINNIYEHVWLNTTTWYRNNYVALNCAIHVTCHVILVMRVRQQRQGLNFVELEPWPWRSWLSGFAGSEFTTGNLLQNHRSPSPSFLWVVIVIHLISSFIVNCRFSFHHTSKNLASDFLLQEFTYSTFLAPRITDAHPYSST